MSRRGPNEGSIRQRPSGRWEARVTLGYGPNGKPIRKSVYGETQAEVRQKQKQVERQKAQGLPPTNERQTVAQFLTRWLADSVKTSARYATYKRHEQTVRNHIVPELGHIRLARLTPHEVQVVLNRKLKSGLAPRSVEIIHATLRRALNQAVEWGDVPTNVAQRAKPPKKLHTEVEPLDAQEVLSLLDAVKGERLEALLVVAVSAGLRQGELLGLRWQDVDFEEQALQVRHAMQRQEGEYRLVEPKSNKSRRRLPLCATAVAALRAHRVRQAEERLEAGPKWQENDLVFPTAAGRPTHPSVVVAALRRGLKKAGLRQQRFHDLRHCCASLLVAEGVHWRVIMEMLGHSQIGVTMNLYSHVTPSLKRVTAERMDSILSRS